jgi:hypothetical protein
MKRIALLSGTSSALYTGEVKVLMDGAAVPAGLEEVGLVQAIGYGLHADLQHVIEGLRAEAAELGCDTVAQVKVDQGASQASANGVCLRTASR